MLYDLFIIERVKKRFISIDYQLRQTLDGALNDGPHPPRLKGLGSSMSLAHTAPELASSDQVCRRLPHFSGSCLFRGSQQISPTLSS